MKAGSRWIAVLAMAAAIGTIALATAAGTALATSGRACQGTITAQRGRNGVKLVASDIRASGRVGCDGARKVVHDFIFKKIDEQSEECAGRAVTPPFRGCRVDGYNCRATGLGNRYGVAGQECTRAGRKVTYREKDISSG